MERVMENDTNDISHLDGDLLLPPRKRLLAGMKRQNSDMNLLIPSSFKCGGSEFEARMNSLLKSHLSNPYLSNEEIVEASRLAAKEASKVARAARAVAEEKAAKAAKAVAAAKSALELVAIVNEETANEEKYLKRNKMKKHVAIQSLYGDQNGKTDEELARNLHRVINSSPRILKGTSTSESDYPKNKKLKVSPSSKKTSVCNVGTASESNQTLTRNGIVDDVDSDGCVTEKHMAVVDLKKNSRLEMEYRDKSRFSNSNLSSTGKREGQTALMKQQVGKDVDCGIDKKKYKIKQKKLPLSICNVRDLESPKEGLKDKCSSSTDNISKCSSSTDNISKHATSSKSLISVGPSGDKIMQVESGSVWKCKAFKVPACVKQNKVMQ